MTRGRVAKRSSSAREAIELISVIPGQGEKELVDVILEDRRELLKEVVRQGLVLAGGSKWTVVDTIHEENKVSFGLWVGAGLEERSQS